MMRFRMRHLPKTRLISVEGLPSFFEMYFTTKIRDGDPFERVPGIIETFLGVERQAIFHVNQVHGSNLLEVKPGLDTSARLSLLDCDGMLAKAEPDEEFAFLISVADCLPVLFVEPVHSVVAAVHAGWRGIFSGIATHAIEEMKYLYKIQPENLITVIGPAISACCFEVSYSLVEEFADKFLRDERKINFIKKRGRKWYLDLKRLLSFQLEESGIRKENLLVSQLCTSCEEELFYSYRREHGLFGRNAAILVRRRESDN